MNLQLLNSGQPNEKLWLNPVCNVLTCNQLITPTPPPAAVEVYNMYGINIVPLVTPLTAPADIIGIPNANINIANNRYVAPVNCFLLVNYSLIIYYANTSLTIGCTMTVTVNGVGTYLFDQLTKAAGSATGPFTLSCNGVLQLNAGDIVGFSLLSSGNLANTQYGNASLSGTVL